MKDEKKWYGTHFERPSLFGLWFLLLFALKGLSVLLELSPFPLHLPFISSLSSLAPKLRDLFYLKCHLIL